MNLPENDPVVKNLQATPRELEDLLEDLRDKRATGYVSVNLPLGGGDLLTLEGRIVGGFPEKAEEGERAVRSILDSVRERALIDVYTLPREAVLVLMTLAQGDPVFRGLRGEFTDLRQLLLYLEGEGFTGCVSSSSNGGHAIAVMTDGAPSCSLYLSQNELEWGGRALRLLKDTQMGRVDVVRGEGEGSVFTETLQLEVSMTDRFGLLHDRGETAWVDRESARIMGVVDGDHLHVSSIEGSATLPCKVVECEEAGILLPRQTREKLSAPVGAHVNVRRD